MGKFGPMIREIRLAKGMTLNELARDIVSVPFLSKYERGTSDISAENFFQLLDRLNVRLSEFEALNANLKQETQDSFLEKYSYAANNDNLILLNQLLADEKQYYQQSANIRHLHNQIILKQYINEGDKPLNYILECWKATAYPEMITNEDGSGNIQYLHSKESKTLMKNYVIKHLEEFIQQIIYINHLDKTKYTISDYVTELWDNWDTFYEYINNIQNESQILFEFNEFLTEFKNNGFTNYINFNFHHIEPKQ